MQKGAVVKSKPKRQTIKIMSSTTLNTKVDTSKFYTSNKQIKFNAIISSNYSQHYLPSKILSGLAKYTYSNIQKAGGLLSGGETIQWDFTPYLFNSTISPVTEKFHQNSAICHS